MRLFRLCQLLLISLFFVGSPSVRAQVESPALSPFAIEQEETFLPVEQAFRLSVSQSESGLLLNWTIADRYFLYRDQFKFLVNNSKTEAEVSKGVIKYDEIFEKDVEKHYQQVTALIPSAQLPAQRGVQLEVSYQGCAEAGLCYPPETKHFNIDGNLITEVADFDEAALDSPKSVSTNNAATINNTSISKLLVMVGFAILGGMILNLMPCVLPVLSLKALSLANSETDHRSQGWAYTLGAITTFFVIASVLLAVRAAGQAVGWGFQLQSPGFVSVLVFLFFVMGLSLSGYIEVGTRWMNLGQSLTQGNGLQQSYFTGALASVVASPCTAPFMAPALGFALTQPWWSALTIFVAVGFGMALPMLLLSYVPNLGRVLPKPGAWMDTFKQALAFPLYLTAIWLLWVLSRQLDSNAAILIVLACLGVVFIHWLASRVSIVMKASMALTAALIGLVSWSISTMSPNRDTDTHLASEWEPYSAARLAELRRAGKPVFVNMTADWCITCKINEKVVFTKNNVAAMKANNIHLIKGDWTNYDPEITQLLEQYDRGGVPLYLVFPAQADAQALVLPQILSQSLFEEAMQKIAMKHVASAKP